MSHGERAFWRETHKPVRFAFLDGRIVPALLLAVMHLRVWTVLLALAAMAILSLCERRGIRADAIPLHLRARILGRLRPARGIRAERCSANFHFEARTLRGAGAGLRFGLRRPAAPAKACAAAQNFGNPTTTARGADDHGEEREDENSDNCRSRHRRRAGDADRGERARQRPPPHA